MYQPAPDAPWSRLTLALVPVVVLIVLVPLLAVTLPPLHDYPFHLTRADAIAALTGQVEHATPYLLGSFALPNVAMDVVTLGLTAFLPPLVAGRVFLGIVLVLLLGGTVALHRVLHGRFSPWPLLAAFFLYNWIFLYGFTNYLFGVAVMLWAVAAWLATRRHGTALRLGVGSGLAVVLLFCHLVAFGLFAVVLGGLALTESVAQWRQSRRIALASLLAPAIPIGLALILFVALSPTAGEVRQPITYHGWIGWKPLMAYRTVLGSIPWLDAVTLAPIALLLAVAAWRRLVQAAWPMLIPVVLLGLTFLVMPNTLFGSMYADARLPIAVLLVVIASLDLRRVAMRPMLVAAGVLLALLSLRSAVIAADWRAAAPVFDRFVAAFATLPAGSTLYAATAEPYPSLAYRSPLELARWHPPLKHVASLAALGRDVFVPSTWADPFKQPIAVPARLAAAKQLQSDNPFKTPDQASLADAVARIRALHPVDGRASIFLLLVQPALLDGPPPPGLEAVATGPDFVLWRVN